MSKATESRTRASVSPAKFAWIVSAALSAAACGGGTDSQTGASNTPIAGSPAPGAAGSSAAGRSGAAGSTGTAGVAGASAAHAGSGGAMAGQAGSSGSTGAAGMPAAGGAGKSGSGAAGMSAAAGSAGSSAGGATFSAVYNALFAATAAPGCNGCHSGMANPALNGNFAMVIDKATAYKDLVGAMSSDAGMCKGMTRVKANDPMSSLLYLKLSGTPPCGMKMPPGGMVPAETLTLVKDWISAGAKDD